MYVMNRVCILKYVSICMHARTHVCMYVHVKLNFVFLDECTVCMYIILKF